MLLTLRQITGVNTCDSFWYTNYWGYYWGRWFYVAPVGVDIGWSGCSAWRTVLAFSFIAMLCYLLSAMLVGWRQFWDSARERLLTECRRASTGSRTTASSRSTSWDTG